MSAKTFYVCIGMSVTAGIIMAAANVGDQSYGGRCRFMGGVALLALVILTLLVVLGLRTKISNGKNYRKRVPLADLSIDDTAKLTLIRYIEDGRIMSKNLPQSAIRIVVDEEGNDNNGKVAILEIDSLERHFSYKFWFIKWPERTTVTETYTLLISGSLDGILDFYATYARR